MALRGWKREEINGIEYELNSIIVEKWVGKERIFDEMNNGFGRARLQKSFMAENTVFLLLTTIICNFYKFLMGMLDTRAFGLKRTSRIKAFVFIFISVPTKWIRTARHYEQNIYTSNNAYKNAFTIADG